MIKREFLKRIAYGAGLVGVSSVANGSTLEGTVTNVLTGEPVEKAEVKIYEPIFIQPTSENDFDDDGNYSQDLFDYGKVLYTLPPGSRSPDIDPVFV